MSTFRCLLPLIPLLLGGCGPELVGTAATTGKLQAEQARQAKAQLDQFKLELSAAMQTTDAAASAAAADQ
ncbi:hypothetical protein D3C80_2056490 [compost metagenome]